MSRVHQVHQARAARSAEAMALAAERLMRRRPLADVSVDEIVSAAGMSVGAFYARFASKDALLDWLCEHRLRAETERLAAALRRLGERDASPRAIVDAYVGGAIRFFRDNAVLLREVVLLASHQAGSGALPATRRASASADEAFIAALRATRGSAGRLRRPEYAFLTVFVAAMLRAYVLFPTTLPAGDRPRSPAALRRELVTWILARLEA